MSFFDIVWFIIIWSAFVAYLMFLFRIIGDVFRNPHSSGMTKALWMIALVLVPFVTAFIYLIAHGSGMSKRAADDAAGRRAQQADYTHSVAGGTTATDQIAQAKQLLDSGAIDASEYDSLKRAALVTTSDSSPAATIPSSPSEALRPVNIERNTIDDTHAAR